ncbi:MAG TPA: hypothetical protein VHC21_00635 [Candidatus Saccharimonadales bacterium]|nr:hypothetical protein [Candidatus Saccharimonadales bacterium]
MGKNTITLDNFSAFHGEVHGVEIQSNLLFEPYVPTTEIDVNLDRIARAARIGHLGSVAIRRFSESSMHTVPAVVNLHDNGTATATRAAVSSRSKKIDYSLDTNSLVMSTKGNASIKINFGHEDVDDMQLREPEAWAQFLDSRIRAGLYGSAQKKFLSNLGYRLQVIGGIVLISGGFAIGNIEVGAVAYGAIAAGDLLTMSWKSKHLNRHEKLYHAPEVSFTPGLPLDRLALAKTYVSTRKFVKAR